jgi:methionyl aminopeptidase
MKDAGRTAAELLDMCKEWVKPGVSSDEIDAKFHEAVVRRGAYPSPLGYAGFPKSICISINEVVCHGIPDLGAVLQPGDLVKCDVSVYLNGVHGDTCRTFIAGGIESTDKESLRLTAVTKHALDSAVLVCGPGARINTIGEVIETIVEGSGFSAVREYSGHGIGEHLHCHPLVSHFKNRNHNVMKEGMTFTIEPMIVEGAPSIALWHDGWTVVTVDNKRAAQFEHTVLITANGAEILTSYPGSNEPFQ